MDTNDLGRSPNGSGYSAEPEPCSTVSAVPVSIPNAADLAEHWFSLMLTTWRGVKSAVLATGEPPYAIANLLGMGSRRVNGILNGTVSNPTMRELHNLARISGYRLRVIVEKLPASAIEARRAATEDTGAVYESAIGNAETPKASRGTDHG